MKTEKHTGWDIITEVTHKGRPTNTSIVMTPMGLFMPMYGTTHGASHNKLRDAEREINQAVSVVQVYKDNI